MSIFEGFWGQSGVEDETKEPFEVTMLREYIAAGDLDHIRHKLAQVKDKCTPGLPKLFESDPSLFQALGSRLARTQDSQQVENLLKILSEADPQIFQTATSDGRSLTTETARFAVRYKAPAPAKVMLIEQFAKFGMDLATSMDVAINTCGAMKR